MSSQFFHALRGLALEDRILNGGALIGLFGVFLPWISGDWLGGVTVSYAGVSFFTSFLGIGVFLCHLAILLMTFVPLSGGPVLIPRGWEDTVRLCLASQAVILVLSSLSVLTKVTFEFSRMEVRFGVYVTLVGSFVAMLYAFVKLQERRKQEVQAFFHHPAVPSPIPPPPEPE